MIYFVTGFTGAVVPIIVEDLIRKDPDAFFYFGLRADRAGNQVASRFDTVVASLELADGAKDALRARSRLVSIDVERERLGIEPGVWEELVGRVEKILHGAADVRMSEVTISDAARPAPMRRHSSRNGRSVTPAIGASASGAARV